MGEFFARLKQRKLVQWALAYIAFAFALIQVVDVVASQFGWPESLRRGITLTLAVGFFAVLVVAWYHGEQGRQRVSGPELLLIAFVLVAGGVVVWQFGRVEPAVRGRGFAATSSSAPHADASMAAHAAPIPAKSIAVLPLANESQDKDQQYFSDGLSDDFITALSQFGGLKVIARGSSFRFRNSNLSSADIGRALGVAHLLEGSVQRAGDTVRISATLVNAADGSTLWSQQYDRPYKDLFALQDEITDAVANALKARLLENGDAKSQTDRPPSGSLEAYNAYLQGQFYAARNNEPDLRTAIAHYQDAVRLDPGYAAAYAALGYTQLVLSINYLPSAESTPMYAQSQRSIDAALRLAPSLAWAHAAKALLLAARDLDWRGAHTGYRRAFELAPNNPRVMYAYANDLATFGQVSAGADLIRQASRIDPLEGHMYFGLSRLLAALGRVDEAEATADKAVRLQPDSDTYRMMQTYIAVLRGHFREANTIAHSIRPGVWHDFTSALALQGGTDRGAADAALAIMIDRHADASAYQIAEIYALRGDPDETFQWLERAWASHDPGLQSLLFDAFILRYKDDPRFAAFCRKVGLPTTTDAKAVP